MLFDLAHVPFSRRGRWLTLSTMRVPGTDERALYLRSVRGGDERPSLGRLCRVEVLDAKGGAVDVSFDLQPACLTVRFDGGEAAFVIGAGEVLHLRGRNATVRFHLEGSRYDYVFATPQGEQCLVAAVENLKFIPRVVSGALEVTGQWQRDHSANVSFAFSAGDGGFEGHVDFFTAVSGETPSESFAGAEADAAAEFDAWAARVPSGIAMQPEARRLAAYLLWANGVPADGLLSRPAIYMSKNHMINIWSWDNAFSALGVAAIDQDLAFNQFAAIFDHQHASGLLPDYVHDKDVLFAFTKPPVHGWALSCIATAHPDFLTPDRRVYLREAIAKQVGYWLNHARSNADVLPAYFHGNDSGWDNASFFAAGGPVISPDLATFLILAAETLVELFADAPGESRFWRGEADHLYRLLIASLWTGEKFTARLLSAPEASLPGESLIQFMPLLLGKRLDPAIRNKLIAQLRDGGFITQWGPATESTTSGFYEDDGYWRGPIWAPTTYLLWDGLRRQGQTELANEIAEKFCALASHGGMAENFDAKSGRGLRDRAFAWTSAVYLLLAASLRQPGKG